MQHRARKGYWRSFKALIGGEKDLGMLTQAVRKKIEPKAPICPTEEEEQCILVAWLNKKCIPHYHIPNGGYRHFFEGCKFKRLGVQSGIPDLHIPRARSPYHGLFLELKRQTNSNVSQSQAHWLNLLKNEGYFVSIAYGAQDGIRIIQEYLGST